MRFRMKPLHLVSALMSCALLGGSARADLRRIVGGDPGRDTCRTRIQALGRVTILCFRTWMRVRQVSRPGVPAHYPTEIRARRSAEQCA